MWCFVVCGQSGSAGACERVLRVSSTVSIAWGASLPPTARERLAMNLSPPFMSFKVIQKKLASLARTRSQPWTV